MGRRIRRGAVSRRQFLALAGAGAGALALPGQALDGRGRPALAAAPATDLPPGIDPGVPVYTGAANPVPAEPVPFDPTRSMLRAIFDADTAAGGGAFWVDPGLGRSVLSG